MHSLAHDYPATLLAEREAPCLSLYQPTHRQHSDNAQGPVRFRNVVKRSAANDREAALRAHGPNGATGAVIVVPSDRMPTSSGAAAIYRF